MSQEGFLKIPILAPILKDSHTIEDLVQYLCPHHRTHEMYLLAFLGGTKHRFSSSIITTHLGANHQYYQSLTSKILSILALPFTFFQQVSLPAL